jgi:hypothetical protein
MADVMGRAKSSKADDDAEAVAEDEAEDNSAAEPTTTTVADGTTAVDAATAARDAAIEEARAGGPGDRGEEGPAHEADTDIPGLPDEAQVDDGGLDVPDTEADDAETKEASGDLLGSISHVEERPDPSAGSDIGFGSGAGTSVSDTTSGGGGSGTDTSVGASTGSPSVDFGSINPIRAAQQSVGGSTDEHGGAASPSVADGAGTQTFGRALAVYQKGTGAPEGSDGAVQPDGSVVVDGPDGTLTIRDNEFVFDSKEGGTTTVGVLDNGTYGLAVVDDATGQVIGTQSDNSFGSTDTDTTTTGNSTTTTSTEQDIAAGTVTSTTTTTTGPSVHDPGSPDNFDGPTPINEFTKGLKAASPTGQGGQGGDVDENPNADPVVVHAGVVPDQTELGHQLFGTPGSTDIDFGGGAHTGAEPTGGPVFVHAGAVDATDDTPNNQHSGPDDDPFNSAPLPLEEQAEDDSDDADDGSGFVLLDGGLLQAPDGVDANSGLADDILDPT